MHKKAILWICVGLDFKEPYYDIYSIAYLRSASIYKHCDGGNWDWKKWRSKGWRCIKAEITIKPNQLPQL